MRSVFNIFLLIAASLFISTATSAAVTRFKYTGVTIRVENGYYKADISYKYVENGESYLRYDYSSPINMIEVIDYSAGIRSKVCGSTCEAGFYPYGAPVLFQQDSDIATGEVEGSCKEYTPAVNYAVTSIWYTDAKKLCKATLSDGKTLVFTGATETTFTDDSIFDLTKNNCPAPICKRVMDLVFVIDNSGSVSKSDWEKAKSFIIDVTNSFDIGTDATMIGVISYDKTAKTVIDLNGNANSIVTAVKGARYYGGTTCTGCGMDLAMKFLNSTSATRNALDPEKMMIVVTDGENNELDYYQYCRRYTSKCTKNTTTCLRYECRGPSHKANGPTCLRYKNTTQCLKQVCKDCTTWGKCLSYDTSVCVKRSTTVCKRRSTTFCNGNPSSYCCTYNSYTGVVSSRSSRCGRCDCTEYRCDEYACEEYKCLVYDCNDCNSYSTDCLLYKQTCEEYQKIDVCDVPEVCAEYTCASATLTCAEKGLGANSLLAGAVSRTRTQWALAPASNRLPIVIAIGVSGANKYELMGIASTLEGKQLMYTVSDFSKLKTIINDLVDQTCTKQTNNLEACDDGCKGFCGCNKKCYCPTCDNSTGSCYSIDCWTDGKTSTGCEAKHEKCANTNKCITRNPDNKTAGCCVESTVDCVKSANKCKIYGCNSSTGCTESDVVCTPSSPCVVASCDPTLGCVETPSCPDDDPCKVMSCSVVNGKANCSYTDKCSSNDPCKEPVCTEGVCSLKDKVCTPDNACYKSTCYNGECIQDINITRKIECSARAEDSCTEGYCDTSDGECKTRPIEPADENCQNCGLNKTLDCASKTDECFVYTCAPDPNDTVSKYPTKCEVENVCQPSDDPCIVRQCVGGKCVTKSACRDPTDNCETVTCVRDNTAKDGYRCDISSTVEKDDLCYNYYCNETTRRSYKVTRCQQYKCKKFDSCEIVEGEAKCKYKDNHTCVGDKCTEAYCEEETGQCVYVDNSSACDLGNPCMIYKCYNNSGCDATPIVCDDNNPCTYDACVPVNESDGSSSYSDEDIERGYVCTFTPKCPKRSYCENVFCNSDGECSYSDYACDGEDAGEPIDNCHSLKCDDITNSCISVLLPTAFLDVCGSCVKEYGNDPDLDIEVANTKCVAGMSLPSFAAAIGGAAIAGIVIAAIVVAAIIGVSSAIGTKELIKRAKKNAEAGTNSNPLYEGNDNESTNPAFTGND